MNILFIDNFDSFSHTLVDEFARRGAAVQIWRNNIGRQKLLKLALGLPLPRLMVISPGPGTPAAAGHCVELVRSLAGKIPIFGVCLGHQVMVAAFAGTVGPAGEIIHGKASRIDHDGKSFFANLPNPLSVGRYHSLAATRLPREFCLRAKFGEIPMAVEHETLPLAGVQFHPESILTPQGGVLIDAVMRWAATRECNREGGQACAS